MSSLPFDLGFGSDPTKAPRLKYTREMRGERLRFLIYKVI
jgi:hypothetical protein